MVKNQKIISICGMISPILFTMIWILGGILQPEYSHVRDDVSSLLAVGAPNKLLFDIMHVSDVLLMIVFLIGFLKVMKEVEGSIIGPALLLVSNVLELLVALFFPLDHGGEPITFTGQMHVIIVMLMGFIAMGGMVAMWRGLRNVDEWKGYDTYSLISFIFTLVFGLVAAIFIGSEIMGLAERLVIVSTGQYFFIIALKTFRTSK